MTDSNINWIEEQMLKYYNRTELSSDYNLGFYRGILQTLFSLNKISRFEFDHAWEYNDFLWVSKTGEK